MMIFEGHLIAAMLIYMEHHACTVEIVEAYGRGDVAADDAINALRTENLISFGEDTDYDECTRLLDCLTARVKELRGL